MQIGPPLSLGTKGSARSNPPGVPVVTYCGGELFWELFSRVNDRFSIRLRALFEPSIFALFNPLFPSGYLFINAVPFYFRIISFNPIFSVSYQSWAFLWQAIFLHLLHCWVCSRNHTSSILILRAVGLLRWICMIVKTNLTIQHLPQFNTCGCLLTF